MENPWNIQSIYELQYFNCPSCNFKDNSKQEFINHACENHPEAIEHLKNIQEKSLSDIVQPWNVVSVQIIKIIGPQILPLNHLFNYISKR